MEVITLASIIEEETVRPEEYPVIAGVYINRLNKNIPLSACPTLKFALGDFTLKRILNKHMEIESPYNTYKNQGLPPGPIRMASVNVIDAVLHYKKHDYLYFCAKSDFSGGHYFRKPFISIIYMRSNITGLSIRERYTDNIYNLI